MDRRDFLKKSALAAGAISLGGGMDLLAQPPRKNPALATGPGPRRDLPPVGGPFRKGIMWGTIGVKGTVLEKFQAARATGFEGIEPYVDMDRAEVLDAMAQTGIAVTDVCCMQLWSSQLSSPEAQIRKDGVEALVRAMEDAKAYGTDTVLVIPGVVSKQVAYDECWERSTACLREALPEAERLGVKLAIENVWNKFLLSPLEAVRFVDQFESPMVGFYFDVGNILPTGWPAQWIRILGDRILRIHLKDYSLALANAKGDKGKGFDVTFGEGDNDWKAVMEALREHYRYGWLTVEHAGGESPEGLATLSGTIDKIIAG